MGRKSERTFTRQNRFIKEHKVIKLPQLHYCLLVVVVVVGGGRVVRIPFSVLVTRFSGLRHIHTRCSGMGERATDNAKVYEDVDDVNEEEEQEDMRTLGNFL